MGFTSLDNLLQKITQGNYLRVDNSKITPIGATAGGWHFLARADGYPQLSTFPSTTDLVWMNCNDTQGDGTTVIGMQHGPDTITSGSTTTKHLINMGAMMVAAAGAPWQLKLVDLQGYYRLSGANVTGTGGRTCINSNNFTASDSSGLLLTYTNDFMSFTKVRFTTTGTLPTGLSLLTDYWLVRQTATTAKVATSYANAKAETFIAYTNTGSGTHTFTIRMPRYEGGVGCQAFFCVQTLPTAGGPTLSASSYMNSDGVDTRAFHGTPTFGATADAYLSRIPHSGNAAGRYGPFLPLRAGDKGIERINTFTLSGGTAYTGAGVLALCIVKPLADICLPVTGMWSERDLINQLPSLPKIEDGACLAWMLFGTGATTTLSPLTTTLDFAWG